jgi:hypothetical protein
VRGLLIEREGHLTGVGKLLNLITASGHVNHLQMMRELPDKHTWFYQKFSEGLHAIRRIEARGIGLACGRIYV